MAIKDPENKRLINELTLEYVKQNNMLQCSKDELSQRVQDIVDISNIIEDAFSKGIIKSKRN